MKGFMIMILWEMGIVKAEDVGVVLGEGTEHTSESWRWGWCLIME